MSVRLLMRTLALLLVLTWAPLTTHCQLEGITGLELLQCHSEGETPISGNSHCDNSSCCDWEAGQYRLPQNQSPVADHSLVVILCEFGVVQQVMLPALGGSPAIQVTVAAELAVTWQFAFRAALPIRAPSAAS